MTASLAAGLQLMLIGMGIVFTFLTLLVAATALMSAFAGQPATEGLATIETPSDEPTLEELAVIGAAIARHRQTPRSPSSQ